MWWLWLVFAFSTTAAEAATIMSNCSNEAFCAKFRNQVLDPKAQFYANITAAERVLNTIYVPLSNENGETLTLELSVLFGHKLRIRFLIDDSQFRYHMREVLPLDKQDYPPDMQKSLDTVTVTTTWAVEDKFIVRSGPPFTVECYHLDQLETVLNGDRLVVENTDESLAFSFGIEFEGATDLYGLGHHGKGLALLETTTGTSEPYRLKNVENFAGYDENSPLALYGSIPAVFGHSASHSEGIFLHNSAQIFVDVSYTGARPSAYFMVECGIFDIIVFQGPTPRDVTRQYTSMTGTTTMPQLWTLGFHQNTYSNQNDIQDVVAQMDAADFPMETLFINFTDGYKYFQWNLNNFPDPLAMQANISITGRSLVALTNSQLPVDLTNPVYVAGKELDSYVKNPDGLSDYRDLSYPGESVWVDFLNSEVRFWYSQYFWYENFPNTTRTIVGFWIDIDEPAVFNNDTEGTFPPTVIHFDQIRNREIHNMFPLLYIKSINSGLSIRDRYERRWFIMNRSFFAKMQAYGFVWNGDNILDWSHLQNSISECLTLNLLGTIYCGAGIGETSIDTADELLQRWYQMSIWIPFFKASSSKGTFRREPYQFSPDIQSVIRLALKTRYRHLPYMYRLLFDHTQSGDPLIRPLFYAYPGNTGHDDHWLIGEEILSRPVLEPGVTEVQVTFPGSDSWYRVDDDSWTIFQGGNNQNVTVNIASSPYFYRGGSIIPRRDLDRPSTNQTVNDPFQLYVNLDSDNNAVGLLYLDDYVSLEYRTKISFFYNRVIYVPDTNGIRFEQITGNPDGFNVRIQRIIVHRPTENSETSTTIYTKTRDGTPLEEIDIVNQHEIRSEEGGFTIYL